MLRPIERFRIRSYGYLVVGFVGRFVDGCQVCSSYRNTIGNCVVRSTNASSVRYRTIFVRTNDPGPWEFRLDDGRAGYWNGKPPFGAPEGRDSVPDRLHGGAESPSSDPHPRHAVASSPCIRLTFNARHTRSHSPRTLFRPRTLKRRKPSASLIHPIGASVSHLHSAYRARYASVASFWAMRAFAAGSLKK